MDGGNCLPTSREREILDLLTQDRSPDEIAAELGIQRKTVYASVNMLKKKYGVKTTHGLAIAYVRNIGTPRR